MSSKQYHSTGEHEEGTSLCLDVKYACQVISFTVKLSSTHNHSTLQVRGSNAPLHYIKYIHESNQNNNT